MTTAANVWTIDAAVAEMTDVAGAFGPGNRFVSFRLDGRHTEQNQFASTVLYGTVTVTAGDPGTVTDHRLVIKSKSREPLVRDGYKTDLQFHNEILFYERIAPFLLGFLERPAGDRVPSLCRYFYGRNDCGDLWRSATIVLENSSPHGYRSATTPHGLFLDFDHLIVAVTALAKFHGMSYRAKHAEPEGFAAAVAGIQDTYLIVERKWIEAIRLLLDEYLDRLAERRGGADDERARWFRADIADNLERILADAMRPAGPLSVLCHGDFNRNNLMFRYDDRGKPVDALAFDMATVRYGSPMIDLSFLLYMNTDRGTRDAHWDALLDAYCAALSESVADAAGDVRVPDRGQVDLEMRGHAFYGLGQASFFVRVMLERHKAVDLTELFGAERADQVFQHVWSLGGDEATDAITDSVQHYVNLRYQ